MDFNMKKFELFVEGRKGVLSDWSVYCVKGEDREKFFQGQTTNDLMSLNPNEFALNARVDRTGKIQFFFLNIKTSNELYLAFPKSIAQSAIEELDKFIIMDDVEIEALDKNLYFTFLTTEASDNKFEGMLYGVPATLSFEEIDKESKEISNEEIEYLCVENGWPRWGVDITAGDLINNTRLNDLGISYTKGCFLGQETVAKIENGRGASFYPSFLTSPSVQKLEIGVFKINDRKGGEVISKIGNVAMVKLFREFRIDHKSFIVTQNEESFELSFNSYSKELSKDVFAHDLYLYGVSQFQAEKEDLAIATLSKVIKIAPNYSDAYESLGVIYGRQEKFELGIELMDKLLSVNEESVMAHTNKSLYLMRLGKIEEAEEEKGLATLKSFAEFGKIAKEKKAKEELDKQKEEEIIQRESMFKQVLEIDADDTIANFGMGDVYFHRKEYSMAKTHLERVIAVDAKYSTAYSLLGKTLEVLGEKEEAKRIYTKGIEVASAKGELMPANEMQARLVKL
ncbi:hypothetical protein BIY24_15950 [Halobacteriovorax marinus]|nr:hypothetical protein BIY24_15950 [Halobacteriovorax marinus]